ncbi:putative ATP-grasp-modified RiPP [Streptomyces sp. NPDC001046]|uniref:putative ATP-grasp-modified RiPP n=1 Tax=unclassified Streptomyces TaxID=2593676 RepID=UPI0035DBF9D0
MGPFLLAYAQDVRLFEDLPAYTYDPTLQLNVLADGTFVVDDLELLRVTGTTTSTAGSKTHFDD